MDESKLLHRDDLPMDVVEEIEAAFAKLHPGCKITFAGDHPGELPQELKEGLEEFERKMRSSLMEGRCTDCGIQMENWAGADMPDDWQPAKGWKFFTGPDKAPMCWQ